MQTLFNIWKRYKTGRAKIPIRCKETDNLHDKWSLSSLRFQEGYKDMLFWTKLERYSCGNVRWEENEKRIRIKIKENIKFWKHILIVLISRHIFFLIYNLILILSE